MMNHAVRGYALARSHQHDIAWNQLRGVDFDLRAVADHPRMPWKLFHEAVNGGVRAPGRVTLQRLADQHDEHGFGRRQILARSQRCDDRHADRQVSRDLPLQQSGDGGEECAITGDQGEDRRRIEAGDRSESAGYVQ